MSTNVAAYRRPTTTGRVVELVLRYLLYVTIVVVFLVPFAWMVFGSLRQESEIHGMMFPFTINTIWPVNWSIQSYLDIFGLSEEGPDPEAAGVVEEEHLPPAHLRPDRQEHADPTGPGPPLRLGHGLPLPEYQIDHPAPADVRPRPAAVVQDVVAVAPGVL